MVVGSRVERPPLCRVLRPHGPQCSNRQVAASFVKKSGAVDGGIIASQRLVIWCPYVDVASLL